MSFTGGLLLLFDKTTGWTLSIASLATNAVLYVIPSHKYYDPAFASPELGMLILLTVMASFCITGLIILLQKPFREMFNPTTKTWWIIQTLTLACIFDRVYFYLRSF